MNAEINELQEEVSSQLKEITTELSIELELAYAELKYGTPS